jgi:hypothetical protein
MIIDEAMLKNQMVLKNAIYDYQKEYQTTSRNYELLNFGKFLAKKMLDRIEDGDCYCVDMLEDFNTVEKLGE